MTQRGRVRTERSLKRVRAILGGEVVADSTDVLMVWEKPYYPTYYFPEEDVSAGLVPEDGSGSSPALGESRWYTVKTGHHQVEKGAYSYPGSPLEEIRGYIALVWKAMDHWLEEDEEVYVHPRDPYKRVDILAGSRHIRIEVEGTTVADTHRPTLLFETGLPVRYYLPKPDVRLGLLEPSERRTECPYKGTARYWSVVAGGRRHEDLVWSYPFPTHESDRIAGLICFYDEKVDVYVDGQLQERPRTVFA
ncbi:MAG: DUF427 domain-containing protein [Actinomycetota bacterium]